MAMSWGDLGAAVKLSSPLPNCVHGVVNCVLCTEDSLSFEPASLSALDLERCVRSIDPGLREMMMDMIREKKNGVHGFAKPRLVIAGGFIRSVILGEAIRDVDVFAVAKKEAYLSFSTTSYKDWEDYFAYNLIAKHHHGATRHNTTSAHTVFPAKYAPIQFIRVGEFDSPAHVIRSFDFTVTQAAIWYDTAGEWRSLCCAVYYQDLAAKRLVYTSPSGRQDQDIRLIQRLLKYQKKGFSIRNEQLAKIMARVITGYNAKAGSLVGNLLSDLSKGSTSPSWESLQKPIEEAGSIKVTPAGEDNFIGS